MSCRIVLSLMAFVGAMSAMALTYARTVAQVEIIEHGLYTAEITSTERMPNGVERNLLRNICHVVTTDKVPARLNVMFGFRFRTHGTPAGEVVELTRVTRYPVPMKPSPALGAVREYGHDILVQLGTVSYIGYGFDHDWELQTGPWTLEIWQGRRKLAEKIFEVVDRGERPAPPADDSNCFQLSSF